MKINNTSLIRVLFGRQVSLNYRLCACLALRGNETTKTHSVYELRPVYIPVSFTRLKALYQYPQLDKSLFVIFSFRVSFVIFGLSKNHNTLIYTQ